MATGRSKAEIKFFQEACVFVQQLHNTLGSHPGALVPPASDPKAQISNGPLKKQQIPEQLRRSSSSVGDTASQ